MLRVYGIKSGVIISNVIANGPAAKAGLKTGDAITSVDGKEVKTGDELVGEISQRRPGATIKLGISAKVSAVTPTSSSKIA